MSTVKPTSFVQEHAPWSISKIGVAKQCPMRFYLQYVVKKRVKVPEKIESLLGTTVHTALEHALQGLPVNKCFRLALDSHKLTTEETELVLDFVPTVKNFLDKYKGYTKRHKLYRPEVEQRMAVDFDGNPVRFFDNEKGFLRGVIDVYALFKGRPYALILDHKSGKEHPMDHFMNQFKSYMLLLKAKQPDLEKVQVGINFLKTDRVAMVPGLQDVRDIQPIFEDIVTYANDATKDAHNFKITCKGPLCNWCDYKVSGDCPAFADGANGKKNK